MEETKIIEELNEEAVEQVCEGVTNSNGNMVAKIVVAGAVAVAAGVGAILFYKKKKQAKLETEEVDSEENVSEINEQND